MKLRLGAPSWERRLAGSIVVQGKWPAHEIPIGKNTALGKVAVDLTKLPAPREYKLAVGLKGAQFENDWHFWLYPAQVDTVAPSDVLVTADWSAATARLAAGGKVLFTPPLPIFCLPSCNTFPYIFAEIGIFPCLTGVDPENMTD